MVTIVSVPSSACCKPVPVDYLLTLLCFETIFTQTFKNRYSPRSSTRMHPISFIKFSKNLNSKSLLRNWISLYGSRCPSVKVPLLSQVVGLLVWYRVQSKPFILKTTNLVSLAMLLIRGHLLLHTNGSVENT